MFIGPYKISLDDVYPVVLDIKVFPLAARSEYVVKAVYIAP